eukprot:TRINITY_DN1914_c2_g2_i4.p1 TRINITY_DN1914_c2_g2~~TRINITY_DN1914_c2_g2_i4.p1  ORF type:complete len:225 (-),score=-30.30 TRINITY_DN1914_c2_g2_i4:144-818(-)
MIHNLIQDLNPYYFQLYKRVQKSLAQGYLTLEFLNNNSRIHTYLKISCIIIINIKYHQLQSLETIRVQPGLKIIKPPSLALQHKYSQNPNFLIEQIDSQSQLCLNQCITYLNQKYATNSYYQCILRIIIEQNILEYILRISANTKFFIILNTIILVIYPYYDRLTFVKSNVDIRSMLEYTQIQDLVIRFILEIAQQQQSYQFLTISTKQCFDSTSKQILLINSF